MASSEMPYQAAPVGRDAMTRLILARRSVRHGYQGGGVPPDVVEEIIRCGLASPSSKNARPWRLHVTTNRQVLADIARDMITADGARSYVPRDPISGLPRADWPSSVGESAEVLRSVPLGIFVENLGSFSRGRSVLGSIPQENLRSCLFGYTLEVLGIGAAVMNMWLAANALGLQGVFMGDVCVAEREIAARLGISVDLVGVLAVGYSDAPVSPDRVHYDVSDETRVAWHR